jgi:hypothetical protein
MTDFPFTSFWMQSFPRLPITCNLIMVLVLNWLMDVSELIKLEALLMGFRKSYAPLPHPVVRQWASFHLC